MRLLQTLRTNGIFEFTKGNRVYFTVKEFKDDMAKFDNLSFGNFRMIFVIFFSSGLLLLLNFMLHHVVLKAYSCWARRRRRRRRKRRRTVFKFRKESDLGAIPEIPEIPEMKFKNVLEMRRLRLASLTTYNDDANTNHNDHYNLYDNHL